MNSPLQAFFFTAYAVPPSDDPQRGIKYHIKKQAIVPSEGGAKFSHISPHVWQSSDSKTMFWDRLPQ